MNIRIRSQNSKNNQITVDANTIVTRASTLKNIKNFKMDLIKPPSIHAAITKSESEPFEILF